MTSAIVIEGLTKRYGTHTAVDDLSMEIAPGEVVGLLGPNGAGKTTTVEILEGYRRPDAGHVEVLGADPASGNATWRSRVGVMLQNGGLQPSIRPLEALKLFASFYDHPDDPAKLLHAAGLEDKARTPLRRLSGGQAQRLALALALIGRPELVFLDEPTAGMDPHARQNTWNAIRELRSRNTTVVLTTHAMDEAEQLCDRVAIIDHGSLVALGSPRDLTAATHTEELSLALSAPTEPANLATLANVPESSVRAFGMNQYTVQVTPTPELVAKFAADLAQRGILITELRAGRISLEEVFLHLTEDGES